MKQLKDSQQTRPIPGPRHHRHYRLVTSICGVVSIHTVLIGAENSCGNRPRCVGQHRGDVQYCLGTDGHVSMSRHAVLRSATDCCRAITRNQRYLGRGWACHYQLVYVYGLHRPKTARSLATTWTPPIGAENGREPNHLASWPPAHRRYRRTSAYEAYTAATDGLPRKGRSNTG